jgi:hypothetical protein
MAQEIQQLEDHGTWEQVPISDAKTKILPLTWVLRRKQSPDGEIKKLKPRICVRGDLQEGDYVTFAPVVWELIQCKHVPEGEKILLAVWSMKRK